MISEGVIIEKNKIRTILRIALDNNHDSLVLSALGCGVYDCKSEEVAKLFANVFEEEEFRNKFKKVTFAILETTDQTKSLVNGKFKPFYDLFKNR